MIQKKKLWLTFDRIIYDFPSGSGISNFNGHDDKFAKRHMEVGNHILTPTEHVFRSCNFPRISF